MFTAEGDKRGWHEATPMQRFERRLATDRAKCLQALSLLSNLHGVERAFAELTNCGERPYVLGDSTLRVISDDASVAATRAVLELLAWSGLVYHLDVPFKLARISERHLCQTRTTGWGRRLLEQHPTEYRIDGIVTLMSRTKDVYESIAGLLFLPILEGSDVLELRAMNLRVPVPLSR